MIKDNQQCPQSITDQPPVFPIAYRDKPITHCNLVLEGGAMRGLFTCGVTDVLLDKELFCDTVIGVSAGSLIGYNYVAGQTGRSAFINLKYCTDWRYLSMKSFVRTGNAFGREMSFDIIPNHEIPFDYDAFRDSPMRLIVVSSNVETGEADYHEMKDARDDVPYMIASSSMPLISKIVEVDNKKLLDGGTCDSVPIMYSKMTGASKHIVVLTQDKTYVKHANKLMPILRQRYADYPYFLERLTARHYEYNRIYRNLQRMHDAGEIYLIQPPKPVEVSSMEDDPFKLFDLYEQGVETALAHYDRILDYLDR